jgi:hypothetical protein
MTQRGYRRTPYNTRFTPQGMPIPRRPERDAADDVADVEPPAPTPQEGQKDNEDDRPSEH